MASEIRVNKITHTAGVGTYTPNAHGVVIAGIVTANNFSGINSVTATSFSFIDVTDTSNVKVHFYATSIASGSQVDGYNSGNGIQTSAIFIRIGDT